MKVHIDTNKAYFKSLSSLLRATVDDETAVFNQTVKMLLASLVYQIRPKLKEYDDEIRRLVLFYKVQQNPLSNEKVASLFLKREYAFKLMEHIENVYFSRYSVTEQDVNNVVLQEQTYTDNSFIYSDSFVKIDKVPALVFPAIVYGGPSNKLREGATYPLDDDFSYMYLAVYLPSLEVFLKNMSDHDSQKDNASFRFIKFAHFIAKVRGIVEHELSHVVQKFYEHYADKVKKAQAQDQTAIKQFRYDLSRLLVNSRKISKVEQSRAKQFVGMFKYYLYAKEFEPWVITSLNEFRLLLKTNKITDEDTVLLLKKKFLAAGDSYSSVAEVLKSTLRKGRTVSLFFATLKYASPKLYQHAVKLFEAEFSKTRLVAAMEFRHIDLNVKDQNQLDIFSKPGQDLINDLGDFEHEEEDEDDGDDNEESERQHRLI